MSPRSRGGLRSLLVQHEADTFEALALRLRLGDLEASHLAGRRDVRAAVGLLVESDDVHDADLGDVVGDQVHLGADEVAVEHCLAPVEERDLDRPVEVSFLDRGEAVLDRDLIRTKVNLIPDYVTEIRVVDIVGLDKQADGGTHVSSTGQVGRLEVTKTESKGKGFKRVRFVLHEE